MVSVTVSLRPFQSPITGGLGDVITISSGDRPRGLIVQERADRDLTSPPVHLRYTTLILLGSNLGGMVQMAGVGCTQIRGDGRRLHLCLLPAKS